VIGSAVLLVLCSCLTAAAQPGTIIVLNKLDDTASLLDRRTGEALAVLPTGRGPHEVVVTRDGGTAVVSNYGRARHAGDSLTVIDVRAREVARSIEHEALSRPHGLALSPGERWVLVTSEGRRALVMLELADGGVEHVFGTRARVSHMVAVAPAAGRAFVANIGSGSVTVLDLERRSRVAEVSTGAGAEGIAATPDGREVWVTNRSAGTVSVLDAFTHEVRATLPAEGFPIRVQVTPDGRLALVSLARAGSVAVYSVPERRLVETIALPAKPVKDQEGRLFRGRMGRSPLPVGILVPPDGKEAFVACTQADVLVVLDLEELSVARTLKTGREPDGLGFAPLPAKADGPR